MALSFPRRKYIGLLQGKYQPLIHIAFFLLNQHGGEYNEIITSKPLYSFYSSWNESNPDAVGFRPIFILKPNIQVERTWIYNDSTKKWDKCED